MTITKHELSWLQSEYEPIPHIFMCNASYENRCLSAALHVQRTEVHTALIGVNDNLHTYVNENANKLCELFGNVAERVLTDSTEPLVTADAWMAAIQNMPKQRPRNFLCDITTFTHESLLILLKILSNSYQDGDSFMFVYSSAEDYDSPRTGHDKWLSKGVQDVRSVLGYPGIIRPSKKTHLIILVGYEHERATRLIQEFEPNMISLGRSGEGTSTSEKHLASNIRFHQLATEMAAKYAPVKTFEFPSNDPWGTKNAILAQGKCLEGYNVVVAPMNTKLSTIGCALAAWEDESIQLCYAQPIQYNYANYSTPGNTCYILDVPELSILNRGEQASKTMGSS
jgi:hypothetical protein